jgi:DNA-binding transcriptional LysR family regulator
MKLSGIDLNKLLIFHSVMKNNGYRGAAEELHLSKAALSQAMTTLEMQLKKKLFFRINNRLKPTEDADALYRDFTKIRDQLQKSLQRFSKEKNSLQGTLRIGAYFEFAKTKLLPTIEKFILENPEVIVKFRFESPSKLEKLLNESKIDFSISIFPHQKSKNINSHKLTKQELILIGHKSLCSEKMELKQIKDLPIIDYYSDHVLIKRWVRHFYRNTNFNPNIKIYAASAEMVLECVKRKLGLGVIPKYVAEPWLNQYDLLVISPKAPPLFDYIWLNQAMDQFIQYLIKSSVAIF